MSGGGPTVGAAVQLSPGPPGAGGNGGDGGPTEPVAGPSGRSDEQGVP